MMMHVFEACIRRQSLGLRPAAFSRVGTALVGLKEWCSVCNLQCDHQLLC